MDMAGTGNKARAREERATLGARECRVATAQEKFDKMRCPHHCASSCTMYCYAYNRRTYCVFAMSIQKHR